MLERRVTNLEKMDGTRTGRYGLRTALFVSLAVFSLDGTLSVSLEDGTCFQGEDARRAMEKLRDPDHTRVVTGIDLEMVLGNKPGIPYERHEGPTPEAAPALP